MKKSIKIACIIAGAVLIYLGILIGIPFDKADLTLTYYCAMAIVKAILGAACIIAVSIVVKNDQER